MLQQSVFTTYVCVCVFLMLLYMAKWQLFSCVPAAVISDCFVILLI